MRNRYSCGFLELLSILNIYPRLASSSTFLSGNPVSALRFHLISLMYPSDISIPVMSPS